MNRVQFLNGFLIEHVHVYQTLYLDLGVRIKVQELVIIICICQLKWHCFLRTCRFWLTVKIPWSNLT